MTARPLPVCVFSTAPQSADVEVGGYLQKLHDVARWSEAAGCEGMLIYTDNRLVDPWLVAQLVLQSTERLCPLVATQPAYMHPYSLATLVASLGYLHGRRVWLNMVAGGFRNDLLALGDPTPHDARYERLGEYVTIVRELLSTPGPISFAGKFYAVKNLTLRPTLQASLLPGLLMSGSSPAGQATARVLGATAIEYPAPPDTYAAPAAGPLGRGVRVGIIADEDDERAWRIAHARFPEDRRGQVLHKLAMQASDSAWHAQLSRLGETPTGEAHPYWLWPFQNYKTFCPYLVGSYERVACELAKYIRAGFGTFILDIPAEREDLQRAGEVFRRATAKAA